MKLKKLKNKYTQDKLIYLEEDTYKIVKKLIKDIYQRYQEKVYITIGYQTAFCVSYYYNYEGKMQEYDDYISGKAFKLQISNPKIREFIKDNLNNYGLIINSDHFRFVGQDAYIINKLHLRFADFVKMFK